MRRSDGACAPLQCWRLFRLALHLALGAVATALIVPLSGPRARARLRQAWSKGLLRVLGVRVERDGATPPPRSLVVANHVSWVDIFAIDALAPAAFVAKADVRDWPLVGWLASRHDTLFLRRGSRGDARRMHDEIAAALAAGGRVAVFPEGTTTDGSHLLPFHAALVQAAIAGGGPVVPVALRYEDAAGSRSAAAAYAGDTTLWQSIRAIVGARGLTLKLTSCAPLATRGTDRKTVSRDAHATIADALFGASPPAIRDAA